MRWVHWPKAFAPRPDHPPMDHLLHMAPWDVCADMMQGAGPRLAPTGVLPTYGPCLEEGVRTSAGNVGFHDCLLRVRRARPDPTPSQR